MIGGANYAGFRSAGHICYNSCVVEIIKLLNSFASYISYVCSYCDWDNLNNIILILTNYVLYHLYKLQCNYFVDILYFNCLMATLQLGTK